MDSPSTQANEMLRLPVYLCSSDPLRTMWVTSSRIAFKNLSACFLTWAWSLGISTIANLQASPRDLPRPLCRLVRHEPGGARGPNNRHPGSGVRGAALPSADVGPAVDPARGSAVPVPLGDEEGGAEVRGGPPVLLHGGRWVGGMREELPRGMRGHSLPGRLRRVR